MEIVWDWKCGSAANDSTEPYVHYVLYIRLLLFWREADVAHGIIGRPHCKQTPPARGVNYWVNARPGGLRRPASRLQIEHASEI